MSKPLVTMGATLQCSFGAAPSSLMVLPMNRVMVEGKPAANIMDNKPVVNIPPFGVCTSLGNPAVAAATAAALGVLTPAPCIPATAAPWAPGAVTSQVANLPALTMGSSCMCSFGGVIQVLNPGSTTSTAG